MDWEARCKLLETYILWKSQGESIHSALKTAEQIQWIEDEGRHFPHIPGSTDDWFFEKINEFVEKWSGEILKEWEVDQADQQSREFVYACVDAEVMDTIDEDDFIEYFDNNDWNGIWYDYKAWRAKNEHS